MLFPAQRSRCHLLYTFSDLFLAYLSQTNKCSCIQCLMIGPITFYLSDFYGFIHVFSVEEII